MVHSIVYEEAREYLARFEEPEPEYMTELSQEVKSNETKRRGVAAFILILLFAPFVIALISLIVVVVGSFFR